MREGRGAEAPSARLTFRYRDDELVVLVPGDEEDGREIAERMRERIAAQNHTLPAITVSCGIAVIRARGAARRCRQGRTRASGRETAPAATASSWRASSAGTASTDTRQATATTATARRAALAMAVASLEARDRGTAAHSEDVVTLCESIGTRLGLSDQQLDRLAAAAQLHDVGKLAMPTEILNKPGPLNDDEWEIIRQHTVIGERMLRAVPEMGAVASMVRHSHERWDGSGYPDGLAGDEIPLASRIVLCADAFHAIRSDRPYRPGRSADAALTEVRAHAGTQFDPRVVDALVAVARDVRRAGTGDRAARAPAGLRRCSPPSSSSAAAARMRHPTTSGTSWTRSSSDYPRHHPPAAMKRAADFSLRPIAQVPEITPVATITPDLELAPFGGPSSTTARPTRRRARSASRWAIQEPASAESPAEHGTAPAAEDTGPQAGWPPALLVPMPQMGSGGSRGSARWGRADPDPGREHRVGARCRRSGGQGQSTRRPAGGRQSARRAAGPLQGRGILDDIAEAIEEAPPLLDDPPVEEAPPADVVEDIIEESPPLLDEPKEHLEHPHPVEEQPLPLIEEEPIPTPDDDVVTPTPSIAAPDENIFVPTEEEPAHGPRVSLPEQAAKSAPPRSSRAPVPTLPPTRPPDDVPAPDGTETPTTE